MYLGDYDIDIIMDKSHKLLHSSIRKVRVVPGDTLASNCFVMDPPSTNQIEGVPMEFTIQSRDHLGNYRTRGGDKFQVNLDYFGNNVNNRPLMADDYVDVIDQDDGTYKVIVKNPLPGKFRLLVGLDDGLIPGCDPFDFSVSMAPLPRVDIEFEDFAPNSSVVQYRATVTDLTQSQPSHSNTRYVSVVCNKPLRQLTEPIQAQIEKEFQNRFAEWMKESRKNIFGKIQKANEQVLNDADNVDDTFKQDDAISFYWGNVDTIDDQLKCQQLKNDYNTKLQIEEWYQISDPVNYVTMTDSFTDWSNYEEFMRRKKEEEEERKRREEQERRQREIRDEQRKSAARLSLMNPNAFNANPRLCSVNFWMTIAAMMRQCKEKNPNGINLDEYGFIRQYDSSEMTVKEMRSPDIYNVARKVDIKSYGDFLLTSAQRHFFEMINEFEKNTVPSVYAVIKPFLMNVGKLTFDRFKHVHTVLLKIVNNHNNALTLGGTNILSEITTEMKDKVKPLIQGFKRALLSILLDAVNDLSHVVKARSPERIDDKQIEKMSSAKCTFFKLNLNELYIGYQTVMAQELSSISRKIMVQELQFAKINQKELQQTTPSYSVQVPINELFDRYLYAKKRSCRGVKDRNRSGLVNPYKVAYIKENRVVFEAIRSGSLPAISVQERATRKAIAFENAVELLTVLAANHAKRFTREELQTFLHNTEPLMVPFTSLSLLTPFFVNDREDRQVMEHQDALLDAIKQNAVNQITLDIHDNGPPINIKVQFQEPCLLNIGVNVVIKTFMCGIGIQRAINCRSSGMRLFEKKVQKYRSAVGHAKHSLRVQLIAYVNKVFPEHSRETQIYRKRLMDRISRVEQVFGLLVKEEAAAMSQVNMMEYELNQKQLQLESRITTWLDKFDSVASVEYQYQFNIKSIVNEIMSLHKRIYSCEIKWEERYDELEQVETTFVQELFTSVKQIQQTTNPNFPVPPGWIEYSELVKKERDLQELYNDLRFLYHDGMHEKFTQGVIESTDVKDIDNYSVPVRILMLSFMIGEQAHFGCKSGKDRTGEAQDQCMEFAEMREQFGEYPKVREEKQKFNEHRKQIHTSIAMNAGSMDIIRVNVALPGSKMDKSVAGRFLPGFFVKYKGLSSLDNIAYANKDKEWDKYEELAQGL
ncbi:hypothetical protein AKO1_001665 [Acrasis kona]|uniref:Uncharacterized protein n=1 Tax=Acrasis kona TaxID=1008807 RepID=A0AAW2ZC01_9EUKA